MRFAVESFEVCRLCQVIHLSERTETGGPYYRNGQDCGPCIAAITGSKIFTSMIIVKSFSINFNQNHRIYSAI